MNPLSWAGAGIALAVGIGVAVPERADAALTALHIPGFHTDAAAGPGATRLPKLGRSGPLTTEIDSATRDPHVRTAMRLGALLEGGRLVGPWPCGDGGWSCGPYQINRSPTANPQVSRTESQNPRFAVQFMAGRYRSACAEQSATAWRTDPRSAAARCVFRAERPAVMYPASRVRAAWRQLGGK